MGIRGAKFLIQSPLQICADSRRNFWTANLKTENWLDARALGVRALDVLYVRVRALGVLYVRVRALGVLYVRARALGVLMCV